MTEQAKDVAGIVPRHTTLGDQVRAEALRRGGAWPEIADELAMQAERWYGRKPCKGENLALVVSELLQTE